MPNPLAPNQPPSLVHAFLEVCARTPDQICVHFEGQAYTYARLYRAAAAWAERLIAAGVHPGDRVGLFLGNSPAFVAAYLGTHLSGGIVVLINIQYRQHELRHVLTDAGVSLCVSGAHQLAELARVRADAPRLHTVLLADDNLPDPPDTPPDAPLLEPDALPSSALHPNNIALISYTSGTTGRAKGAMLSHANLLANSRAVTDAWHWRADDRLLLVLPLFHIHGLGVGLHGTLLTGATLDVRRRFDAADVYATLLAGDVTMFFGVPTMYYRLVTLAAQHTQRPPPLRLYVSGSAPLSPHLFAQFAHLFGQPILERYGMTETGMNLTNPYEGERRPGTVGRPFLGQEARIVDVQTRAPLPSGQVGEIQVRGPHVFQGYWQRPEATRAAFAPEGWFNTGDLGVVSADGYVTIAGRAKELIITGGYNVYPREVEEVLVAHADIAEAALVGLPHADLGEQVVAVVVSTQPLDEDAQAALGVALQDYCAERLARYKLPRQVVFTDMLPRNALGKVQKHVLRATLQAGHA